MAFIKLENVSKIYQDGDKVIKALDDVSFEIEKGEIVIILGPSGAGKSTLLNILGGMDSLSEGKYFLDDIDVSNMKERELEDFRRNNIGFVFQFYNLMNNLNALENVSLAASLVKNPLSSEEMIKRVGLEERKNNFPSKLSGGEQQRVAIARALVKNPKLLLCDEPTGALDSKTGIQIIKLLYEIATKENMTVIIVTHNSSLVEVGSHVITINDGKIIDNYTQKKKENLDELKW